MLKWKTNGTDVLIESHSSDDRKYGYVVVLSHGVVQRMYRVIRRAEKLRSIRFGAWRQGKSFTMSGRYEQICIKKYSSKGTI